ncbi:UvrD-helicase domain-containing protein [Oleidesulfovibrio sp.]|uniref:UvrD-helicase domain-containing protein n=1 Tax=Oleidesulfovibrio sp. TaxID=2909707 RepID=UPI003A88CF8F
MKQFRADLHIHSRFSRATSKKLNARHLAAWAAVKGLDVLGTGDFTHPEWRAELAEQLVPDEKSGLLRLRDTGNLDAEIPVFAGKPLSSRVQFMLQAEISSIYKRGGKVRKVHNLVYMPTMEAAEALSRKLEEVGNLASDGRPILGLDSRDLLEMVLETHPKAFLVPAHIWTPWFSLFGSKSGFDSIEECYGDLSSEIFALETGLSSDPDMNWMWSALDRFRFISNSDAHSGDKLGREANLFSGEVSYDGIYRALRGEGLGHRFMGTVEFFPEEGKYHMDGHRKCGVIMDPRETAARDGICPVCGKPLTVGVLSRVMELADRDAPERPVGQPGFVSLVPLAEIVSEIVGTKPGTRKVLEFYARAVGRFGSELGILQDVPEEDLRTFSSQLAEGIGRMRRGEVARQPGCDGEYGVIRVFTQRERNEFQKGKMLMDLPMPSAGAAKPSGKDEAEAQPWAQRAERTGKSEAGAEKQTLPAEERQVPGAENVARKILEASKAAVEESADDFIFEDDDSAPQNSANEAQQKAIAAGPAPVLVLAGPGTGKTRTLIGRIRRLIDEGVPPRHILAVTFTRRAATEMDGRLLSELGENTALPRTDTLHALAFEYWHKAYDDAPVLLSEEGARRVFAEANPSKPAQRIREAWERIAICRERMSVCHTEDAEMLHRYVKLKESWNLADYTDLLEFWLEQVNNGIYASPYVHVLVDEIQDLSPLQLTLVRALMPATGEGFFGIGDPNQSIYGFRGAHGQVQEFFGEAWPSLQEISLTENYRSSQAILDFAGAVLPDEKPLHAARELKGDIRLFEAPTAEGEASWIAGQIRALIGATSHSLADSGAARAKGAVNAEDLTGLEGELAPGDIAVLVRFKAVIPVIQRTLVRLGIPCSVPEAEAFWVEPRVQKILSAAGRFLGIAYRSEEDAISCPDKVLAKGPLGVSAYLQDLPPFDNLFWQSSEFKRLVKAYDEYGGWAGLLNWVHLQTELELVRSRSEKVQIMSLHASKGLEFKAVFLPALEDGILPFAGAGVLMGSVDKDRMKADEAEERRLFYVGMTRAEQALFLSRAARRVLYGKELRLKESRFFKGLPLNDLRRSTLVAHQKRKEKQLTLM